MATYATQADCLAYIEGLGIDDPTGFERLLARAERDIDNLLTPATPLETTGLRVDPAALEQWERDALADAVAAQVEWRLTITVEEQTGVRRAPLKKVAGPDFSKEYDTAAIAAGRAQRIGPKVRDELRRITHLRLLSTRAVP